MLVTYNLIFTIYQQNPKKLLPQTLDITKAGKIDNLPPKN
jgi:hypothetical protein